MDDPGLLGAARLRELLDRHSIRPSKALGQNFVIDPNTIRKVVKIAEVSPSDHVVEVGAGAGSLTLALASAAQRVTALEFDRALLPLLEEVLTGISNVSVVHADAMRADLQALGPARVVANLPYNIATPMVLRVLHGAPRIGDLTVMTQREVGERFVAPPGSRTYGRASLMVAFFAEARLAGRVSRSAFFPTPNVDSVIVRIVRRPAPAGPDPEAFSEVVGAAFAQRRKMLRGALAPLAGSSADVERALAESGIDPEARAEQVGLDGFVRLAARM